MSKYRIKIEGKVYEMEIERVDGAAIPVKPVQATPAPVQKPAAPKAAAPAPAREIAGGADAVVSPMPGTVNKVFVSQGEMVKKGQAVLILEAMKMENEITAPKDGVVAVLNVSEGQTVQGGAVLFQMGE